MSLSTASPPAPSPAEVRAIVREYVRWTLYVDTPRRATPPLCLPRLDVAAVTESDVYAARPGSGDPHLDATGRPRERTLYQVHGEPTLVRGATEHDQVAARATRADAWREYLRQQVGDEPALLRFERETVLALVDLLAPRDRQAIADVAHCTVPEAAYKHHCSPAAIKTAARHALDHLTQLLYASANRRGNAGRT